MQQQTPCMYTSVLFFTTATVLLAKVHQIHRDMLQNFLADSTNCTITEFIKPASYVVGTTYAPR